MAGYSFLSRLVRINAGGQNPSSADSADLVDTVQFAAQLPLLTAFGSTGAAVSGVKIAYGSSALISGAKTVATGLSTVISFQAELIQTGAATGATEATSISVSGTTGASIATGDVNVVSFRLNTQTLSVSGTGGFYWMAIGT